MRDLILSVPDQLKTGIALGAALPAGRQARVADRPYRFIVSCGMGGSAIAGEMLSMVKDNVIVHWDYDLPVHCGASDLVVCTSWSGDTEETLSSYGKARELGMDTLVITSGGKLAALAKEHGTPLVLLPRPNMVPRANAGFMTGALLAALGFQDQLPAALDPAALEGQARELARAIGGRMPVVYTSYPWRKLTGFWKMAYSETAKRQVMVNWFPSGAHNEIVGWEGPYGDSVAFLLLRDQGDASRYTVNFDALLALLGQKEYTVLTVQLSGNTPLEKVFNSYLLALWTGYHAAQGLGIDPMATELLDEFKRLKAQK